MQVSERYTPVVMSANATVPVTSQALGGFICTVGGTITVVNNKGVTMLNACPVTAGVYLPLPMYLQNGSQATVTLASGAAGTLLVG